MKITFGKSAFDGYWYIENNQGSILVTSEEAKELVKQMKKEGF